MDKLQILDIYPTEMCFRVNLTNFYSKIKFQYKQKRICNK